jgi:hypothetical protein
MRSIHVWLGLILAAALVLAPAGMAQGATKPAPTPTTKAPLKPKTTPAKTPTAPAATPTATSTALGAAPTATSTAAVTPTTPERALPFSGFISAEGAVHARSGPGLYYYPLTMLPKDTALTVMGESGGWLAVVPPASVFGLVRKADVTLAPDGKSATVDADSVRLYAGSDTAKRQWCVMATLAKGDALKVLGLAEDDFLKVAPPTSARVYVAAAYVTEGTGTGVLPTVAIELPKIDPLIEELGKLDVLIEAEGQKPLAQQDYAAVSAALKEMVGKTDKDYLKKAIEDRQAFVASVGDRQRDYEKVMQIQRQLEKRLADIRAEEAAKVAAAEKEKKNVRVEFAGVGVVQPIASLGSVDYPIKYKLVDRDGKEIMVLKSAAYDLAKYVGKVVGVRGPKTFMPEWRLYCVTVDDLEVME